MIQIVEGRGVGSGKSYFVLTELIELWRRGGTAYVTDKMEILWPETKQLCEKRYGVLLEDDQLRQVSSSAIVRLHEHTAPGTDDNPVLIVLDEAQDELNARDWSDKNKRELFSWCCQSRHDDNDLIFISQSSANVDKQVRRLATFVWHIRNSVNTPIMGLGKLSGFIRLCSLGLNSGRYFIANQLDQDGKTIMSRRWLRHDKGLFGCYRSKAMRLARKRVGEAIARKKLVQKAAGKPMLKIAVLAVIFGLAGLGWNIYHRKEKKPAAAPAAPAAVLEVSHAPTYLVRREKLMSRWPGAMRTDEEDYEAQTMCSRGWVVAVLGNVAKIVTPDSQTLFIVGGRKSASEGGPQGGPAFGGTGPAMAKTVNSVATAAKTGAAAAAAKKGE